MALSNLLAGLEAEAAAEATRLETEAREEADRIVEAARAEARALRAQVAQAGERELRRDQEQRRSRARLEAAAMLREAREEAFQAFAAELHGRLVSLRERADYPAILRTLIRESIAPVPAATVLRVDPRDERLVAELRRELAAELEVEPTLETAGGVELADRDGRTARNTIEERLANAEPELRLLFGAMFGGRPPAGPEPEPEQAKLR